MQLKYLRIDKENVEKYLEQISNLIVKTFTSGYYYQLSLKKITINNYVYGMFRYGGFGQIALDRGKVVGIVILSPIRTKLAHPKSIRKSIDLDKSLSLRELAVLGEYQHKGIGSNLLKTAIDSIDVSIYKHIMLKVLVGNIPAISLYSKFGFQESTEVSEKRTHKDGKAVVMKKKFYIKTL